MNLQTKMCSKCKEIKKVSEFNFRYRRNTKKLRSQCRKCEREYLDKWELLNRKERLKYKKQQKKLNRDLYNFYERKRKFVLRSPSLFGTHTVKEWESLKKKYNYTCLRCLKKEPEIKLTEDHIIPISLGGSNNIDNIQPLCVKCNQVKSNRDWRFL